MHIQGNRIRVLMDCSGATLAYVSILNILLR